MRPRHGTRLHVACPGEGRGLTRGQERGCWQCRGSPDGDSRVPWIANGAEMQDCGNKQFPAGREECSRPGRERGLGRTRQEEPQPEPAAGQGIGMPSRCPIAGRDLGSAHSPAGTPGPIPEEWCLVSGTHGGVPGARCEAPRLRPARHGALSPAGLATGPSRGAAALPGLRGNNAGLFPAHAGGRPRGVSLRRASPSRSAHNICFSAQLAPWRGCPGTAGSNYGPSVGKGKGDLKGRFMSCLYGGGRALT